jgi:hypothetical protein
MQSKTLGIAARISPMPKYHFQQRMGHRVAEDDEGSDFPDIETARQYALRAARELLAESIRWNGKPPPDCIVVMDGEGRQIMTVLLVEVLPESIKALIR